MEKVSYKKCFDVLTGLSKSNICLYDLMIVNEIDCQKEKAYTDEELEKIREVASEVYLKSDNLDEFVIVKTVLENVENLDKLSTYDLIDKALNNSY